MTIIAIITRIIRQFRRDKRSLALMFIAPLFVLTLMWLVFDSETYIPTIAVVDGPDVIVNSIEEEATVNELEKNVAMDSIKSGKVDALITFDGRKMEILLEGSDPNTTNAVRMTIQQALKNIQQEQLTSELTFTYLHGSSELGLFDHVGPVLIGFFVFFFVFIIGGVSFLRERTQGTLDRMLATPLKRWEIVSGYVLGFGIFTIIQSIIIAAFAIYILNMWMDGSFGYVLLITFLLAMTALTLGTLLSAYANNEFQMIQFIPLVIVPQVFFSGLFNLETMAEWLRLLGKVMPLTYGAEALRDIMIRGKGVEAFYLEVFILIGFSLSFYLLNIVALKKHRKL